MAVAPMPNSASHPPRIICGTGISRKTSYLSAALCVTRNRAKVAPIDRADGREKRASQDANGGIWLAKNTRLAGLEIGSTKLAALATKAQIRS